MNGVLVSRSALLPAPSIVPSSNNIISRAAVAGNNARVCIPLYPGIKLGDKVDVRVWTNGDWIMFTQRTVVSIDEMIEVQAADPLFALPTTSAIPSYVVNGDNYSAEQVYTVGD